MIPSFDIKLTEKQKPLLIKVKQHLEENLGFDGNSVTLSSPPKVRCY
jgi:hypothetical protein